MKIHLRNIFILILSLVVAFLLLRYGRSVVHAISCIERLGPGHSADEQLAGVMAIGFIGVSVVAIVRLLTQGGGSGRGPRDDLDN